MRGMKPPRSQPRRVPLEVPRKGRSPRVRIAQQGGVWGAGKASCWAQGVSGHLSQHLLDAATGTALLPPARRGSFALLPRPGPWSCATARRPANLSQGTSEGGLCLRGAAEASGIKTSSPDISMLAEAGLCF